MMNHEDEEDRLVSLQRSVIALKRKKDFDSAHQVLDAFLRESSEPELRSEALALRAECYEEQGNRAAAEAALREAIDASTPSSYARFTLEITLGGFHEKQGALTDAASWYRRAMQTTISASERFSGSGAVKLLLALRGENGIDANDRALANDVLGRSWAYLGVQSRPTFSSLAEEVASLAGRERDLRGPTSVGQ